MKKDYQVIVVGGGQAGLAVSYGLKSKNIDHIVLDRGEVGDSWKHKRWDNFTLVTPNWQCELPGYKYKGANPNGFMGRDEVVDFVRTYAESFNPPLVNGVEVLSVSRENSEYIVETSIGILKSEQVVIAAGAFHDKLIPSVAYQLPSDIVNLHSSEYKNASQIPSDKAIMVVGSGQSGCQIAEDLHLEGRKVHLCVGNAPRSPRNYRGRDVVNWLEDMGYYKKTIDSFPDPVAVRNKVNHYLTGRDGGREIDLRAFALEGMKLYGLFKDVDGSKVSFGDNLEEDLEKADLAAQSIKDRIDEYIAKHNIEAPEEAPYVAPWHPDKVIHEIDLEKENIGAVIWSIGYRTNFSWVNAPVFDERGHPISNRGITTQDGLYFIGLPWMHTWGSGRFSGITTDANYLVDVIEEKVTVKI